MHIPTRTSPKMIKLPCNRVYADLQNVIYSSAVIMKGLFFLPIRLPLSYDKYVFNPPPQP